jgi:ABC-type enterochelin transport system substrate-binding protein
MYMDGESVERLMDIVLQMKINLGHVTETLCQQSHEIQEQLGKIFEQEKKALEHCLCGIDDKLTECSVYVDDYRRLYMSLATMREKLVQLGAEPSSLPPDSPSDQIEAVVAWRLQELRSQGKI